MGNAFPIEQYFSRFGPQKSGNGFEGRGFSGAVCADKSNDLTVVYVEGNVLESVNVAVIYVDAVDLKPCQPPPFSFRGML